MTALWTALQRHLQRHIRGSTPPSSTLSSSASDRPTPLPSRLLSPFKPSPVAHQHQSLRRLVWAGLGTSAMILALRGLGALQWVELELYDLMLQLRPVPPTTPVVVVGFKEDFVARPGAWPVSDDVLAQVLTTITRAEPAAIGLDIYRDSPRPPGQDSLKDLYLQLPNLYVIRRMADQNLPQIKAPPILVRKGQVGFNNVVLDYDGRLRRSVLYWWESGIGHRSFALKLAEHYLQQRGIYSVTPASHPDWVQLGQATLSPLIPNSGGYLNKDTAGYQILADFRGGQGTLPTIDAQDILDGNFDPAALVDRIVVVGVVAESVRDSFQTSHTSPPLQPEMPISGVEMQAQLVTQLLDWAEGDRPVLRSWSQGAEVFWILAWTMAGAVLGIMSTGPLRSSMWAVLGGAQLVVVGYGSLLVGVWMPVVPPILGGGVALGLLLLLNAQQRYELERSKDFLKSIIAAVPEPVFVQDKDHRWVVLNPAFEQLMGYPLELLLNQRPSDVLPPPCAATFQPLNQSLWPPGTTYSEETALLHQSGRSLTVLLKRSFHCDRAGNAFLVGTLQDITAQKHLEERLTQRAAKLKRHNEQLQRSQEKLHHQIHHDALTTLGNRQFLYRQLTRLLQRRWDLEEEQTVIGVLFLDLDGFKAVNDRWGHQAGDDILVETAQRLRRTLRGEDVVTRLAGDEFVVVLPGIPHYEAVAQISHKIIHAIDMPFFLRGDRVTAPPDASDGSPNPTPPDRFSYPPTLPPVTVTVSIGIAFYPDDAQTPDHLIAAADHAMLSAKRQGKNNYQYYAALPPIDLAQSRHVENREPDGAEESLELGCDLEGTGMAAGQDALGGSDPDWDGRSSSIADLSPGR